MSNQAPEIHSIYQCTTQSIYRAGLITMLTRLQPRAPNFYGPPLHAVSVTEQWTTGSNSCWNFFSYLFGC